MSPTSSPSSSADSPPDSSPADTTFSASDLAPTARPSFVPLTYSQLSRLQSSANPEFYQPARTRKSLSLSPPAQRLTLTNDATTAIRHNEEFDYAAEREDGPEDVQGESSRHHPSHQTGKKKRTRTLTTPHQSAVLHALLAQSRFPTTAMREEVGRAIGLSARKVQVWFQNQRQKARKPRSVGRSASVDPSLPSGSASHPQFGPFNAVSISSSFSGESIQTSALGLSSSSDLSRKSSVYDDERAPSGSPTMTRGLPTSIPPYTPGGPTSGESEFHMGASTSSTHPTGLMMMYNEQGQFRHTDHRLGSGMPLRTSRLDSPHSHKGSVTQQSFPYYSPSAISLSANPNASPSSAYPFIVSTGGPREPIRSLDSFSSDPPIILPPLRMTDDVSKGSIASSESSNTNIRPDPQLRYSASFPSYSQDTGNSRSSTSSIVRSSAPSLPPPFTLQPRPQWDWDKPLGPVLPSFGRPSNTNVDDDLRQPQESSSLVHLSSRPRTTSDPSLPPIETRQSALLTEPWPLPPVRVIDQSHVQQAVVEGQQQQLQYGVAFARAASGEKSSSETQITASPPSNRLSSDASFQQEQFSTVIPQLRDRDVVERSRDQVQGSQLPEEDRQRPNSTTPNPLHLRP